MYDRRSAAEAVIFFASSSIRAQGKRNALLIMKQNPCFSQTCQGNIDLSRFLIWTDNSIHARGLSALDNHMQLGLNQQG